MQWGLFQQVQDEQQQVHEQAAHQSGDHPSRGGGDDGWLGHLGRNGGGRRGGSSRLREHRRIKARASKFWRQALHDQFQINEQVVGRVVPVLDPSGQHVFDDLRAPRTQFGIQVVRWHQLFLEVGFHDLFGVGSGEGNLAGHHVIEGRTQSVDVGRGGDIHLASDLFRRDVERCAECFVLLGFGRFGVVDMSGQSEIGQLRHSSFGDHDVPRLDVAVQESFAMSVLQCQRNLLNDLKRASFRKFAFFLEEFMHISAVHVLHDEVMAPSHSANVHRGNDVGVVQFGGRFAFLLKAFDVVRIRTEAAGQNFDCHQTVQADLAGQEDRGHGARTQLSNHLVARDGLVVFHGPGEGPRRVGITWWFGGLVGHEYGIIILRAASVKVNGGFVAVESEM